MSPSPPRIPGIFRAFSCCDIWDTAACIEALAPIIRQILSPSSPPSAFPLPSPDTGGNRSDYIVLNLGGGTAAAKAALYLCTIRAVKTHPGRFAAIAIRFLENHTPLRLDLLGDTSAAGILVDAMNTCNPAFRKGSVQEKCLMDF